MSLKEESRTKKQLIDELILLRRRIEGLEESERNREKTLADLQGVREQFDMLSRATSGAIHDWDMAADRMWCSDRMQKTLGVKEIIGDPWNWWVERLHPEDRDRMVESIQTLLKSDRESGANEYRIRGMDLQYIHIFHRIYIRRDGKGKPLRLMGAATDITERKQAELALRESEKKYRELIESTTDLIYTVDRRGLFTYVNPRFEKTTGYLLAELRKRPFTDVIAPEFIPVVVEQFKKGMKGEAVLAYETDIIRKNGSRISVEFSVTTLYGEKGKAVGRVGMGRDITDRKKAENALRTSEKEKAAILDAMSELVLFADKNLKVIWSNNAMGRQFGIEPGALAGRYCYEALHGLQRPCRICPAIKALDSGEPCTVEDFFSLDKIWNLSAYPVRGEDGSVQGVVEMVTDTTARKRTEESLRESELRYRTLFDNANDAIFTLKDDRFLECNRVTLKMFGCTREQIIGSRPYEFSPPFQPDGRESKEKAIAKIRLALAGKPQFFEWKHCRYDGTPFDAEVSLTRVSIGDDVLVQAFVRDITDRKGAEAELAESQRRLSAIIEFLPDATLVIDKDGRVIAWNRAIETMTGVKAEEMLGRGNYEYALPFYGERRPILIDLALHPDREREEHYTAIRKMGDVLFGEAYTPKLSPGNIHLSATASVLRDSQGEIYAAIECIRNNTERKQAEDALMQAEEKYRGIFENAVEGMFQSTLDGRFISVNPAQARMCGYDSPEDMVRGVKDIAREYYVDPERRDLFRMLLDEKGFVTQFENEIYRKDGSKIWVSLNARAVQNDKGRILYYEGTQEDITWRKQMEEEKEKLQSQLLHAQKLEAVGTLAGGIAHDFNNLLMGVQGYASLMLLDIDKGHPFYDRLKSIEGQIRSGADLTRQLLGFARGGRYEIKPTDLNNVIEKTSAMFGRTKKEITIHIKYGENLWAAEVDQGQIEQVLLNLYVNAWQAMPGGGNIYLETGNVRLDKRYAKSYSAEPGRYVKISVTDTGVGMDEKTRKRIFEPFFTTKTMGRGTGLGLATVYGIIKGHRGIITVYSEKGRGATFNIYLPASEKEALDASDLPGELLRGRETILVIDDEEVVLDVTRELLEGLGYRVLAAMSGGEAIGIYNAHKENVDLVILDLIMPGMGGGETFDLLKSINPDVRAILSSGYSLNGEAIGILERGCAAFIQKPISVQEMSQKIREVLDRR